MGAPAASETVAVSYVTNIEPLPCAQPLSGRTIMNRVTDVLTCVEHQATASVQGLPPVTPAWLRSQLIGRNTCVTTPFGERRIVYADHVASGRSLQWVEDFIAEHVLPMYANTHTEDSATGARMTALAHDAARRIKASLGAQGGKLLFCGTGCTAAIKRLQA